MVRDERFNFEGFLLSILTLPVFPGNDYVAVPCFDGRGSLLLFLLLLLLLLLQHLSLPLLIRRRLHRHLGQGMHAWLPRLKTGNSRLGTIRQSDDLFITSTFCQTTGVFKYFIRHLDQWLPGCWVPPEIWTRSRPNWSLFAERSQSCIGRLALLWAFAP